MRNQKYWLLAAVGMILVLAALGLDVIHSQEANSEEQKLVQQAHILNSIARLDSLRKENINKIIAVIDRFNSSMDQKTKGDIANAINTAATKYQNLDVDLICATITHETGFTWNPRVVSPAGAFGLMQVMPETGRYLAGLAGVKWSSDDVLFDPVTNIRLGARYLSGLIEVYQVDGGLAAYNGGSKRAEMWLAQNRKHGVLFAETQNYVPAVLSLYESFKQVN